MVTVTSRGVRGDGDIGAVVLADSDRVLVEAEATRGRVTDRVRLGHYKWMVFIGGGWGPRRRRRRRNPFYPYGQDPYGQQPGYGYPPAYGYRRGFRPFGYGAGGGSCLRDMLLFEGGCCLAESLGCGPQLVLATPALVRARRHPNGWPAPSAAGSAAPAAGSRLNRSLISLVGFYQREISPQRPACCRFSPTCSHYAMEALQRHGALRGTMLAARRVVRCRPGAAGGSDPVPLSRP